MYTVQCHVHNDLRMSLRTNRPLALESRQSMVIWLQYNCQLQVHVLGPRDAAADTAMSWAGEQHPSRPSRPRAASQPVSADNTTINTDDIDGQNSNPGALK